MLSVSMESGLGDRNNRRAPILSRWQWVLSQWSPVSEAGTISPGPSRRESAPRRLNEVRSWRPEQSADANSGIRTTLMSQ